MASLERWFVMRVPRMLSPGFLLCLGVLLLWIRGPGNSEAAEVSVAATKPERVMTLWCIDADQDGIAIALNYLKEARDTPTVIPARRRTFGQRPPSLRRTRKHLGCTR